MYAHNITDAPSHFIEGAARAFGLCVTKPAAVHTSFRYAVCAIDVFSRYGGRVHSQRNNPVACSRHSTRTCYKTCPAVPFCATAVLAAAAITLQNCTIKTLNYKPCFSSSLFSVKHAIDFQKLQCAVAVFAADAIPLQNCTRNTWNYKPSFSSDQRSIQQHIVQNNRFMSFVQLLFLLLMLQ